MDKENKQPANSTDSDDAPQDRDTDVEFVSMEEEQDPRSTIKELRQKLKQAQTEKQEYLEGWQRAKADFVNFRNQQDKARADFIKFSKEDIILQIIPVLDSFDMALGDKNIENVPKDWLNGIKHIYNQLRNVLKENGVTEIDAEAKQFDPAEHNAVESVPTDTADKDHHIAAVVQRGYKMGDKVIRPATVKVFSHNDKKE